MWIIIQINPHLGPSYNIMNLCVVHKENAGGEFVSQYTATLIEYYNYIHLNRKGRVDLNFFSTRCTCSMCVHRAALLASTFRSSSAT